jgi:serine/threonine protein kinase
MKPDNLLISSYPRIKLADFGNVHILPDGKSTIRGLEGTTSYMSPEMRQGFNYGTKTDIWSLGIALLNILFDGPTFPNFELLGPRAARTVAEKQTYISPHLKSIICSMFLKNSDRPTAEDLLQVHIISIMLMCSIRS